MPLRIPNASIVLQRDGKRIEPRIGHPFDFTKEEIADVLSSSPTAMRRLVNEEVDQPVGAPAVTSAFTPASPAAQAANAASVAQAAAASADRSAQAAQPQARPSGLAKVKAPGTDDTL